MTTADWAGWITCTATHHGWRVHHPDLSQSSGFPDIVLVRGPDLLLVEPKLGPNSKTTTAQDLWQRALSAVEHVEVAVWQPGLMADYLKRLQR